MTTALKVNNLKKTYKNGTVALKGLNLTVQAGEIFALLGPNGAGKSTLIGIVSSLVNASSGEVEVFGDCLFKQRNMVKSHIGLVPQEFNFNMFEKPMDILINQAGYYGVARREAKIRAEKYLKQLHLWEKRDSVSRSLSGGMKRRLMIARAMMNEPKLLILDEPTAGVDIEIRRSMWEFVKEINEAGTTIILTTHYLEEAEQLCKNIAIINHGEIIKNTTIKDLLKTLDEETFIFDLQQSPNEDILKQLNADKIDEYSIQINVKKSQALNGVFKKIDDLGYTVISMRNKVNRLEEMFYKITQQSQNLEVEAK